MNTDERIKKTILQLDEKIKSKKDIKRLVLKNTKLLFTNIYLGSTAHVAPDILIIMNEYKKEFGIEK